MRFVAGYDTCTPYTANFDGVQGIEMAYFVGVCVNRKSQHGPLSHAVNATVLG